MKQLIKEYFTFNRREQRGILVLLSILISLLVLLTVLKSTSPAQHYDFTAFEKEIAELEKAKPNEAISDEKKAVTEPATAEKFYFNPNNLPETDWKKLGFSEKQIKTIKNYESKGGKFYKKGDLKKIYGISDVLYASIEFYIQIPEQTSKKFFEHETTNPRSQTSNFKPETLNSKLELNSADSFQLVALKGIGPAFASRIMKYRKKLGGFISPEQLKEVYGITEDFYKTISPQISVDPEKVEKININEATLDQLKNHPYIKYKTASLIINYRIMHGAYTSVSDIKNTEALPDSIFTKTEPYLKVN